MSLGLMFELTWKSGLVAAVALAGASFLKARPASERVAVLRLGVALILALPVLVALMPSLHIDGPAIFARATSAERIISTDAVLPTRVSPVTTSGASQAPSVSPLAVEPTTQVVIDPVVALLALWGAGLGFLMLRLLAGVVLLHRWTRRAAPVSDARWLAALERAHEGQRSPALLASLRVTSPLSWGWRPSIILLDMKSLDQAGRADAVLAHEMGHIRHRDWLFLMASRLLVALFWFNPLVWILQRELARQSEQAADAWAAGRVGRADYAAALVAIASRGQPHAALGMAAPQGEIARRVIAILNLTTRRGKPWGAVLASLVCLGVATPLAAVELRAPVMTPSSPSVERIATLPRSSQVTVVPAGGPVAQAGAGAALPPSGRVADEADPDVTRSPSPSDLMRAVRSGASAGFDTNVGRVVVDPDDQAFGDALDALPSTHDWNGRPNREQGQQVAQQLRDGAGLIDNEVDKMRRTELKMRRTELKIRRAELKIGDPEHREQMLDDTNEMKAEAAALRQEADAMERDG